MAEEHNPLAGYWTESEFRRSISPDPEKPISKRTVKRWDERRIGPPRIRLGNLILYPKKGVQAWLEKRLAQAEAQIEAVAAGKRSGAR